MRRAVAVFVALLLCTSAFAQEVDTQKIPGPSEPHFAAFDREMALNTIFAELATARDRESARLITRRMFAVFMMAPDRKAANMMNRGLLAARRGDMREALANFNDLIIHSPQWPEAWNQRAYIYFQQRDFARAIVDCEKTVELEPRHLGCLTGLARIHTRETRRYKAARSVINHILKLHPHAYERVLLGEIPKGN